MELRGQHVRVIPMEVGHIEALFEAGQDPRIWKYMFVQVSTLQDMRDLVEQALAQRDAGTEYPFVVEDLQSRRIVGSTRFLDISPTHRHVEIGWTWYTPSVWRTAVNTETKYLLLRHCFERLQLIRVQLKTDSRNVTSQRAIERIGATREGVLRKHMVLRGYVRDSVYYSILDREWETVKLGLEKMLDPIHYNQSSQWKL